MACKINIPELKIQPQNEMDSWLKFINRFKIATIATDFGYKINMEDEVQKAAETEKRKGAALLNAIGEDGMEIFEGFGIEVEDIRYERVVARFEEYFRGRENKTILRHRLFNSRQKPGEEQSDFIKRMKRLASQCQLAALENDMAVHAIINGLEDDKLRSVLLQRADLDINVLETTCAQFAAAERTVGELRGAEMEVARSEVKGTGEESIAAVRGGLRQSVGSKDTQCYKCLGFGHMSYQCTQRIRCNNCRKEGHKAADCFQSDSNRGRGRSQRGRGQRGGYRGGKGRRGQNVYGLEEEDTEEERETL